MSATPTQTFISFLPFLQVHFMSNTVQHLQLGTCQLNIRWVAVVETGWSHRSFLWQISKWYNSAVYLIYLV